MWRVTYRPRLYRIQVVMAGANIEITRLPSFPSCQGSMTSFIHPCQAIRLQSEKSSDFSYTFQHELLLSPLNSSDSFRYPAVVKNVLRLVAPHTRVHHARSSSSRLGFPDRNWSLRRSRYRHQIYIQVDCRSWLPTYEPCSTFLTKS